MHGKLAGHLYTYITDYPDNAKGDFLRLISSPTFSQETQIVCMYYAKNFLTHEMPILPDISDNFYLYSLNTG